MSETITNLKVRFGADTKQFKKGMDDAKVATTQFKSDAGNAMDQFASAFGVNMAGLRGGFDSLKASLLGVNSGFKAAAAGSNIFSKALQFLKVALISTGIGALVVALGSVITFFTKTERGADTLAKVMASIGAVTDVLIDRVSLFGEKIVWAFTHPREAIAGLWDAIKTNIVNRFEGLIILFQKVGEGMTAIWKGDWDTVKQVAIDGVSALAQIGTGLDKNQQIAFGNSIKGVALEISKEAKAAADLESRLDALEDKEISLIEVQARRDKEIAKARADSKNTEIEAEKRRAAIVRAFELENQTLNENKALQAERISIMQAQVDMGESMASDLRALAEEKAKLHTIETESLSLQKGLQRELNTLTKEIESETAAIIKLREAQTAGDDGKQLGSIKPIGLQLDLSTPNLEFDKLAANMKAGLQPAKDIILDFSSTFNEAFLEIGVSFAEGIGGLIAGTSGFDDFGKGLLSTLGGLLAKVGEMVMAAGLAFFSLSIAFKAAISNPATALIAIAAGAALIAVGTAVQSKIASSASGGGGGTFSGSTAGGGTFDTRTFAASTGAKAELQPITITVTGEFRQRGTDMVATINETTKRSGYRG